MSDSNPPAPDAHRGRVQAQGADMQRTESEPWARSTPPKVSEVLDFLDTVWGRLSKAEQRDRAECYRKVRQLIQNRQTVGPIDAPFIKSFTNRKMRGGIRLDVEVLTGQACV